MSKNKIELKRILRFSPDDEGLVFSLAIGQGSQARTVWLQALPNTHNWPGLGPRPKPPERPKANFSRRRESDAERQARWAADKTAEEEWKRAQVEWQHSVTVYDETVRSDSAYRQAAEQLIQLQHEEPQEFSELPGFWFYRDKVVTINSDEPETLRDKASDVLAIKHFILRRERSYEKVKREVEALENLERLQGTGREPIPESVRLFVWQRDRGQCVKCGSREKLEFDHIIPVVAGGSSTERNVQLLCEPCNRSKGSTI